MAVWDRVLQMTHGKSVNDQRTYTSDSGHDKAVHEYAEMFQEGDKASEDARHTQGKTQAMVNFYYDLVTDFYEYGWGQSFHFGTRFPGETFDESIKRHEYYMAAKMQIKSNDKVADLGCGVMGPARNISRFSHGATVYGINNNAYQLKRAATINAQNNQDKTCIPVKADFVALPFDKEFFDAVYSIEASCHAPDRVPLFKEVFNKLKPGGRFAVYEWCVTDHYDPENAEHRDIKHWIEKGDGLPSLAHTTVVLDAFRKAGFEIIEAEDLAETAEDKGFTVPWFHDMMGGWSLRQFRLTKLGRFFTHKMCSIMELLRIAPKGTTDLHNILIRTADALVKSGQQKIFTPMFFVLARKPLDGKPVEYKKDGLSLKK